MQSQVGWSVFLVLYPGQHYVCMCVHACFPIVLHVFGDSGILITPLEHILAYLSLLVSCLLVLARLGRVIASLTRTLFLSLLTHRLVLVLMHTVSSFGICQGMSWQHLNQPCVAG